MDSAYLPARLQYLEAERSRLESENAILRAAMQTFAIEGNRLMAFYLAFKCWQDNGCPVGEKTCAAMLKAYREASEL